jgi:WD40 repeat protein
MVQVWDIKNLKRTSAPIAYDTWVFCATFSPDGQRIVTACVDGTSQVCEAETGKRLLSLPHPAGVKSAEFSPDGRYIVTAGWDYAARIWDASTGELVQPTLKHSGKHVMYASFTPDGFEVVTVGGNGVIDLWNLAPMKHCPIEEHVLPSPNGRRLFAIKSNSVEVFDAANNSLISRLDVNAVTTVRPNKDGSLALTLSKGPTEPTNLAQLWDADTGKALTPFSLQCVTTNAFLSDDASRVVAWEGNKTILWDTFSGQPISTLSHAIKLIDGDDGGSFSTDGAWLATISDSDVHVWNAANGAFVRTLPHADKVAHVAFSPNSRYLVTCCESPGTLFERYAQIWQVATGKPQGVKLRHGEGVLYADFSPDSRRVVTASDDNTAAIWDVLTGNLLLPPLQHPFALTEARFSANGRWIVTACLNNEIGCSRVWDAQTGEPLTPPMRNPWPFKHVQFVDADRAILTRRSTGQTMIWKLSNEGRTIDELALLASVLSGHQQAYTGSVPPQTPDGLLVAYQRLRKQRPNDFEVSPADVIKWHLREAEASEKADQWTAAVLHWNELIKLDPKEQTFHDRLDHARGQLNRTNAVPSPL